jgi:hypothetical protein
MSALMEKPGILMFLNCCLLPFIMFGIGVFVGRYRPRIRLPFTVDQDDHERDL